MKTIYSLSGAALANSAVFIWNGSPLALAGLALCCVSLVAFRLRRL